MKNADGRYVFENRELAKHIQRIRPGITTCLGSTDHQLFRPSEEQVYVDNDRQVIESGTPLHFDEASVDADGTVRHWSTFKFPRIDEQGRRCVAGISIDITDTRLAKRDAQVQEQRCALAIEAGRMGTMTMNLATLTLDTSPFFAVLHGRPETKTQLSLEDSLADVHPDDRPSIMNAVQAAIGDKAPSRIRYRVVRPDGDTAWIELIGQVYCDDSNQPTLVRAVGFDVTARQLAYEEVASGRDMLRRLIEVQENERQTLCHELHDGMMQHVIGAKMVLEKVLDTGIATEQTEAINIVLEHLSRGIAEGREVIRGVRSAVLDDLGLVAAVQDLGDQLTAFGIDVEVIVDDALDSLSATTRNTVYRVVQESLANVRKHSNASHVSVEIRYLPAEIRLRINDNGVGFDAIDGRKKGFGILGMTERVKLAGGSIEIDSCPTKGTHVQVFLPVTGAADEDSHPPPPTAS